jgi:hypothetical protein
MPFIQYARLVSSTLNMTAAATAQDAVDALIGGTAINNVVPVANPFPVWPNILRFDSDTVGTDPTPVWAFPGVATQGQSIGFAVTTGPILLSVAPIALTPNLFVDLAVFADNAVEARVQAYSVVDLGLPSLLNVSNFNVALTDGNISDPSATNPVTPPYGWQNVRYYSAQGAAVSFVGIGIQIVISFQVMNYLDNGPVNPGGLSFIADIYGDLPLLAATPG